MLKISYLLHRCYIEKVYQAVFWISAADEESLLIGYARLAEKLELPEKDEQELYKIVDAVKDWLETASIEDCKEIMLTVSRMIDEQNRPAR